MMSLTFGLFNQVSGLGPLGPLVKFPGHPQNFLTFPWKKNHFPEIFPDHGNRAVFSHMCADAIHIYRFIFSSPVQMYWKRYCTTPGIGGDIGVGFNKMCKFVKFCHH